ncbi:hypothetical protein ACTXT7_003369 [Hymenolepis weldensis]
MFLKKRPRHPTTISRSLLKRTDDSESTIITSEMEFDTDQFRNYNREHSKECPFTAGDCNTKRGENTQCPLEQAPAIHKRQARRKRNIQKPEVATPPKFPQPET